MVFGSVIKGQDTVRMVERTPTDSNDSPDVPCVIVDCGEIAKGEDDGYSKYVDANDPYPEYPEDLQVCVCVGLLLCCHMSVCYCACVA